MIGYENEEKKKKKSKKQADDCFLKIKVKESRGKEEGRKVRMYSCKYDKNKKGSYNEPKYAYLLDYKEK